MSFLKAQVHVGKVYVYVFRAMASSGSKEQFLRQMEQIVEGIKQSHIKVQNLLLLLIYFHFAFELV